MTRTPDRAGRTPSGPAAHGSAPPVADPAGALPPFGAPAQTSPAAAPQLPAAGDPSPAGGVRVSPREVTSSPPAGSRAIAAAMSEDRGTDSLDAHVRKLMKDLGLWGFHVEKSLDVEKGRTNVSRKGYPDWTIAGPRGQMWRELKAQRGTVSPDQRKWLEMLCAGGGNADVWRPADLLSGRISRELAAISGLRATGGAA